MSAMRKRLAERERERMERAAAEAEAASSSEEEEEEESDEAAVGNAFGFLGSDDDDDDDDSAEESSDDEEEEEDGRQDSEEDEDDEEDEEDAAAPEAAQAPEDEDDNLDAFLAELRVEDRKEAAEAGAAAAAAPAAAAEAPWAALLRTSAKFFDATGEVRRRFGAEVARLEAESNGEERRRAGGGGGRATSMARASWPVPGRLLGMRFSAERNEFSFTYSDEYERLQAEYERVVNTHDPRNMAEFLRRVPFHAGALLQMSQVYLHHGNAEEAETLLRRCIHVHELGFHPRFRPGSSRLDAAAPENDCFLRAVARYSNQLAKRGCTRTALEFSKVLLGADPEGDPGCALHLVAFLAVRAREYRWLLELADTFDASFMPARLLPNVAYSCALAKWLADGAPAGGGAPEVDLVEVRELRSASASRLLVRALLLLPEALPLLVEDAAAGNPAWRAVLDHPHFRKGRDRLATNPLASRLCAIHAARCGSLWKTDKVRSWLLRHCREVCTRLGQGNASAGPLDRVWHAHYSGASVPDRLRMLVPWQYSDAAAEAMPEELMRPAVRRVRPDVGYEHIQLDGANPLMTFLRTLLPWVHAEEDEDRAGLAGANPPRPPPGDGED